MKHAREAVLLGIGALLLTSAGAGAQQRRTNGSGIRITKERETASVTTTTPPPTVVPAPVVVEEVIVTEAVLPAFDLAAYSTMNDNNVVAHLAAGDSLELQMSRLAQTKGTDQGVRDYATMLASDHSAHLSETIKVINDERIQPMPLGVDPEGARMRVMLDWLNMTPAGVPWDAAFLRFQVAHHQNEIDVLSPKRKHVQNEDLDDLLEDTLKALAKHRDSGRSAAMSLGVTVP